MSAGYAATVSFLVSCGLGGLVEEELADQLFHDHCGLGLGDALAVLEHGGIAAGIETDVNLSQEAGGVDRRNRVLGELVAAVDAHGDHGFVALSIEPYRFDAADHHASSLHWRAQLEPPDVVEARFEAVTRLVADGHQVAHLEGQEDDRPEADRHEDANPEIDDRTVHVPVPRNMNTVITKSSARIASEEMTTV